MWPKRKSLLRRVKARPIDALLKALPVAFYAITVENILGCFQFDGYFCL